MIRNEYPRPQFERAEWTNLNGEWDFCFDDEAKGLSEHWEKGHAFDKKITVPFCFESKLSGIGDTHFHDNVWYRRKFSIKSLKESNILHFGAADFETHVFINGKEAFYHKGGQTPFEFDVKEFAVEGENELVVHCYDPGTDTTIPRGKQYWKEDSEWVYYTRTTGIWRTVWLESVPENHIKTFLITPDVDKKSVTFKGTTSGKGTVSFDVKGFGKGTVESDGAFEIEVGLDIKDPKKVLWCPENPYLFDVEVSFGEDKGKTYFGLRKIEIKEDRIYLNGEELYQRLVLDQGYNPDGILTNPSDEYMVNDLKLVLKLGFNGLRLHQKTEEDRFYYHADKMGVIVWGECANAYDYSKEGAEQLNKEWDEIVPWLYNHPCILTWVPINESWGFYQAGFEKEQSDYITIMYEKVKKADPTRIVSGNDGWEMTTTDILAVHNYRHGKTGVAEDEAYFEGKTGTVIGLQTEVEPHRTMYCPGFGYRGEPILLTEFSGISLGHEGKGGWGYTAATDNDAFLKDLERIMKTIYKSKYLRGFCYTQFTNVEQEQNGLLNYDRTEKIPCETLAKLIKGEF